MKKQTETQISPPISQISKQTQSDDDMLLHIARIVNDELSKQDKAAVLDKLKSITPKEK